MKCPVCKCFCKNKLSLSHHLKMMTDKEHRKYLNSLKNIVKKNFNKGFSSNDIAREIGLGQTWIISVWKKNFTKEQYQKHLHKMRVKKTTSKNNAMYRIKKIKKKCKNCKREFITPENNQTIFCCQSCYFKYKKKYGGSPSPFKGLKLEQIHTLSKAKEIKRRLSIKATRKKYFLICKCGQQKRISGENYKKHLTKTYLCKICKNKKLEKENNTTINCSNCGKSKRLSKNAIKKTKKNLKFNKESVFFCNRRCYMEYYRSHPERYRKQRSLAEYNSIVSFRQKSKFIYKSIKFCSNTEMKCAQYIEKELKIKMKENKTCHVKVNNIEVDFLLDDWLAVEYHQCFRKTKLSLSERIKIRRENKYRYEYRTLEEYFLTRRKKLPKHITLVVVESEKEFEKILEVYHDKKRNRQH